MSGMDIRKEIIQTAKKGILFTRHRRGYHLVIDQVPACLCTQCGEPYFEEEGVKVIFRNIADVAAVRKADDSFRYVHLLESGASSAAMKPGYGSAFGGVVKGIKKNVIITIAGSAIVATTYKSFKPGVAIMTGEEVIENSDCDLDSIYMNPVIKDKDIESKLATYRKEKENEQKK